MYLLYTVRKATGKRAGEHRYEAVAISKTVKNTKTPSGYNEVIGRCGTKCECDDFAKDFAQFVQKIEARRKAR